MTTAMTALTRLAERHIGRFWLTVVFLFLYTDDFQRDYDAYRSKGVKFVRKPKLEAYGTVAVFEDVCGNLWDLVQSGNGNAGTSV